LLLRQPCSVVAAPKAALIATAQASSPGVTNWIVLRDLSSTRSVLSVKVAGRADACRLAPSTNADSVPWVTAALTWSVCVWCATTVSPRISTATSASPFADRAYGGGEVRLVGDREGRAERRLRPRVEVAQEGRSPTWIMSIFGLLS
jgi:hypothetical protein